MKAVTDEMLHHAAVMLKFPDGCTAIYRGELMKILPRVRAIRGAGECVLVRRLSDGRCYTVAVKNLLTQDEWEEKLRRINEF